MLVCFVCLNILNGSCRDVQLTHFLFCFVDACSGGADKTPDGTVYAVLDAQGLDPQSLQYRAIRYYIEVCQSELYI